MVSTAISISFLSAIPVESITGLPFDEIYSIKSRSVISNDAILYIGLFNFSKKSTEVRSNGVEKQIRPSFYCILFIRILCR